jgi:uncharacterized damage-inducible protein DinB
MSISDLLLAEFREEAAATRALLDRVPEDHLDWKPHEKSMNLSRLATHVAEVAAWTKSIVGSDELDFASPEMQSWSPRELQSVAEIQAELDGAEAVLTEMLGSTDDEAWNATWTMRMGDQELMRAPRYMVFRRQVMNHLVHHRAQLGVFLRLLDVPLPMLYGPTADEDGGMGSPDAADS